MGYPGTGPSSTGEGVNGLETLRILIAEDHPLYRKGMISLLQSIPEFEVVGEASTGEEAVARASQLHPEVILMDLQMPEVNGIEATRRILRESPNIRVLMVTLFEDDDSVFMALRAGARGYILKDADEEEMVLSIRAVGRGEAIFSPAVATRVLAYFSKPAAQPQVFPTLTDREREILNLIARGHPNPSIAKQLSLSTRTVGTYVSNIFTKLQVADRAREAGMG
jgi:DNA-binding NarL/FixJ family response regulator